MIKLQVIGNLGKDCIVNNVNGKSVMNFTVAHSEKYKDNQGVQKERTIWVDCAYWSDRTALAPYLKKGTSIFVEGQPDVRVYTTQDGRNGASLTLRVSMVQLVGGKPQEGGAPSNDNSYAKPVSYDNVPAATMPSSDIAEPVDDLPF
jgi:single-strand DNA-binding protein